MRAVKRKTIAENVAEATMYCENASTPLDGSHAEIACEDMATAVRIFASPPPSLASTEGIPPP